MHHSLNKCSALREQIEAEVSEVERSRMVLLTKAKVNGMSLRGGNREGGRGREGEGGAETAGSGVDGRTEAYSCA